MILRLFRTERPMTKKLTVVDDTVYSQTWWAKQAGGHIFTVRKRKQKLHETSAEQRSRLESTPPSTSLFDVKVKDFAIQASGSDQSWAEVAISSSNFNTAVIKEAVTKYFHIRDVCSQGLLELLQAVGVPLQREVDLRLLKPLYSIRHEPW